MIAHAQTRPFYRVFYELNKSQQQRPQQQVATSHVPSQRDIPLVQEDALMIRPSDAPLKVTWD